MWTHENRPKYNRDHLRYPSDLTDDEWAYVEPLLPPAKPGGGKRRTDMRAVMNGVMYILSTGYLSLTRTATVILGQGARRVIGVGRVKTPTLAIVCRREFAIRNFVPLAYFEIVATAKVAGGQFQIRHAPQHRIVKRAIAQDVLQ